MDATTNGNAAPPRTLEQLREAHERLLLDRNVRILERQAKLLETVLEFPWIDPWERFRGPNGEWWLPVGQYETRPYGADVFTAVDEERLREVRNRSRFLCTYNPYGKGTLKNLTNYMIGPSGFTFTAQAKMGRAPTPDLLQQNQTWLDEWIKANEFGRRQEETFRRMTRDGEAFLRIFDEEDGIKLRFVEPEQVKTPEGEDKEGEWSFGIHTDPDDAETVLGYWVQYGPQENGEEVAANDIEHCTINTDEAVKRGWPDFEVAFEPLESARKLLRNMGEGASIVAAIAMIREHAMASKEQVTEFVGGLTEFQTQSPYTNQTRRYETVGPGEVVDIPATMKYAGTPLATTNTTGFLEILQALLRQAATSMCIPEFMVSADASNNNYASILVTESPFTKNAEKTQYTLKCHFLRILERARDNAIAAGMLPPESSELVELACTPPSVVVTDKLQEAQRFSIENTQGVRSVQTWQQAVGLDPEEEQVNFDEWHERNPMAGPGLTLPDANPVPDLTPYPGG